MFLQSKEQNQQNKKETYKMGENIEKPHMQYEAIYKKYMRKSDESIVKAKII